MKPNILVAALMVVFSGWACADEKEDAAATAKQKAAAEELWKKMEFEKTPALVESKNFLIYSRLTEARSKALSSLLEKHLATAIKGLKFAADEKPWKGKLAVFVLPDRTDFVNFMRKSQKRSPKDGETTFGSLAGDEPMLVIGESDQRVTPENLTAYELSLSLLKRKIGAGEPPDWVADGFARATAYRAANPMVKGKGFKIPIAPFSVLWSEEATAEQKSAYAAYIVDYLAYGPGSDMMGNLLNAIRPGENGDTPSADAILKAVGGGDWTALEIYARKWTKPPAPKTPPKKKP